tara:strand:+ start:96 stop:248 length:153 start_codon:yes stop_codon:yes gene_type:complete
MNTLLTRLSDPYTEDAQQLILSYLNHNFYGDTAEAFMKAAKIKSKLSISG